MTTTYPHWAKWIAQDEDGSIYVYHSAPYLAMSNEWLPSEPFSDSELVGCGTPNPHWRNSLDCLGEDDETI